MFRPVNLRRAALLVLLFGCLALGPGQESRVLTVDDAFAIESVGDPQVNPSGDRVAYLVTRADVDKNRYRSRVWMVATAGGDTIPLTAADSSASSPRWSPDGRYLAFLSARDEGKTQVWALDTRGGEAVALTTVKQGVDGFAWAPDGQRLVLLIRDPAPERDEDAPAPVYVIDRLQFKRDYAGYLDRRRTHLYVFDLDGKALRQLTDGDYDDSDPAWSPAGDRIAFVSNRTAEPDANYNTDIWVVDPAGDDALVQVTTNPGRDADPAWSPDGTRLVWTGSTRPEIVDYAQSEVFVGWPGEEPTMLTGQLDRMVSSPRFSADGRSIEFLFEDRGAQLLGRLPEAGGEVVRIVDGARSVQAHAQLPGGDRVVLVSEADRPANLFVRESRDTLRPLTDHNSAFLAGITLGTVDKVTATSPDGTAVDTFIYRPPGMAADARTPGILWIHGGPMGQYDWGWDFQAHLFAANGYTVIRPNPRGSTGYGQEFELAIWRQWGRPDLADVLASVDHAVAGGLVDPDKLGVGGWSYGGIMTNYVITSSERFAAAISGASGALWIANYGHDHYQHWYATEFGYPWENREIWEELSPYNRVQHATTPTLWIGGEHDWNVPILNSEMMYQAMRALGRDTMLVVYPEQYHGGFPPAYAKDRLLRYLGWFGRLLQDDGSLWPDS